jgi:hypothetical protein
MKEQVSVDDAFNLQDIFRDQIKQLAAKRAKYIEDYIKFWLAVNVNNLELLTPEIFAKDYHLLEKQFTDGTAWQMLPHNQMVIDKEEYDRLKEKSEEYASLEESFNKLNEFNASLVKWIQQKGVITKQELERLKRLEENVKKKIVEINYMKLGKLDQKFYDDIVKMLESLYNE